MLQRVSQASVRVSGKEEKRIGRGYLLLLCVMEGDTEAEAQWLAEKVSKLRLFEGDKGKMNDRSVLDIGGSILVISQFTLAADISKGNRPDYTGAAGPEKAKLLYTKFVQYLRSLGVKEVREGEFGAHMEIELINDGPVTLTLERKSPETAVSS